MDIEFTYAQVRAILEQLAEEFPLRVAPVFDMGAGIYLGCRYLDLEGCPSCVVGMALDRLGIPREEIAFMDLEGDSFGRRCPTVVHLSKAPFWGLFEESARKLLNRAQHWQDRKFSWNTSIAAALEEVPC